MNLRVLPNPARPDEIVYAWLSSDGCLGMIHNSEFVTFVGHSITLTHIVDRFCGVPTDGYDLRFPLGRFPAGSYTLTYTPVSSFQHQYEVQTAHFVIVDAIPLPAVSHGLPMALLVVGMLLIAARGVKRRQRACCATNGMPIFWVLEGYAHRHTY